MLLSQLYSSKGISSFSGLRDGYNKVLIGHYGVAIAELRRIFHLHWYASKLFYDVFTYKSGMPRCATSTYNNTFGFKNLVFIIYYTR